MTRNKILYPHNEYSDQIITVYSTEKQSILCWWMLRPDQVQLPSILGGPTNQKAWKCINHCAIDRITSITSHALPGKYIQIMTYVIFSSGHVLMISVGRPIFQPISIQNLFWMSKKFKLTNSIIQIFLVVIFWQFRVSMDHFISFKNSNLTFSRE